MVTIGQFFATLRRRLVLVLVLVILGVLAAGALLLSTPKTYQATAVVDISPTSRAAAASSVSTITESRIVTSTSVALAAKETLAYTGTPTDLASRVTVTSPLASQVLNITFAAGTAQGAADGANAFANAYLDYRTQIAQKDITLRIGRIQSQVADLQKTWRPQAGPERHPAGLAAEPDPATAEPAEQLSDVGDQPGPGGRRGAGPAAPSSPRPVLYLAGGLLFGLLLGIVLAVAARPPRRPGTRLGGTRAQPGRPGDRRVDARPRAAPGPGSWPPPPPPAAPRPTPTARSPPRSPRTRPAAGSCCCAAPARTASASPR